MEVSDESAIGFIHDGARPMITKKNVADLYEAAASDGAAVLASRVSDTIKRLPDSCKSARNCVLEDLDRGRLWAMQTPQVFVCSRIKAAYERVREGAIAVTDDVAAYAISGGKVTVVENGTPNIKITNPEDIALIQFIKKGQDNE